MAAYTTIDNPELYFQVKLYTGTGSAASITLDGSEDMQPDLVWGKGRSVANLHALFDAVRGTGKALYSDRQNAEETQAQGVTAFDSDGFSIGTLGDLNANTETFVAWCWKESATAGFDIVAYTGNTAGASRTIAHSLSAVPDVIILKPRSYEGAWWYVPRDHPAKVLELEQTNAEVDPSSSFGGGGLLQSTFTSSVFGGTDGTSNDDLWNADGETYIAYCFANKQGFSKFGSYATNNNADGPYIFTGFSPAFVMLKVFSGNTGGWDIWDNKRGFNPNEEVLQANAASAEASNDAIDLLSNGFKIRNTSGNVNGSGDTIVYMAFAEAPFVNSNGVPCNAR